MSKKRKKKRPAAEASGLPPGIGYEYLAADEIDAIEKGLIPWVADELWDAMELANATTDALIQAVGEEDPFSLDEEIQAAPMAGLHVADCILRAYADRGNLAAQAHAHRFLTVRTFLNLYREDLRRVDLITRDPDDPEDEIYSLDLLDALAIAEFDAAVPVEGRLTTIPALPTMIALTRNLRAAREAREAADAGLADSHAPGETASDDDEPCETLFDETDEGDDETISDDEAAAIFGDDEVDPATDTRCTWDAGSPEATRRVARGLIPWNDEDLLTAIGVIAYADNRLKQLNDPEFRRNEGKVIGDLPPEYRKMKYVGALMHFQTQYPDNPELLRAHWYRSMMADAFIDKHAPDLIKRGLYVLGPGKPAKKLLTPPLLHALATLPFTEELPGTEGVAFTFSWDDVVKAIPLADRRRNF